MGIVAEMPICVASFVVEPGRWIESIGFAVVAVQIPLLAGVLLFITGFSISSRFRLMANERCSCRISSTLLQCMSPLMALSGYADRPPWCPLLGGIAAARFNARRGS
jgi:hypothetical protein